MEEGVSMLFLLISIHIVLGDFGFCDKLVCDDDGKVVRWDIINERPGCGVQNR